jgi:hypothetical protein
MIPYILAAVGGYLIGDSLKAEQYAEGGMEGGKTKSNDLKYFEIYDDNTGKTLNIQAYSFEEAEEIASTIEFDDWMDGEEIVYQFKFAEGGMMMAKGGEIKVGNKVKYKNAKYHATVTEVIDREELPYAIIEYPDGKVQKAYLEDLQKVTLAIAPEYVNTDYIEKMRREWKEKHKMANGGIMAKGGQVYKLGDKWSSNFDYNGMLETALKAQVSWGVNKLRKLYDSFEDVNYHRANRSLWEALNSLKDNNVKEAEKHLENFRSDVLEELK